MNNTVKEKLQALPESPGVYFHKNAAGTIIYIGKAAMLKNRVRQYFQKSRTRDAKTELLVSEIADIDWMVVDSEIEALFLEAEMIRRYRPHYNILLRDDKSMIYIRIDYASDFPTVSTTRRPLDDGARYFGPYPSASSVRQALKVLRRVFPFATPRVDHRKRVTLHYHLGLDPGLEEGKTSLKDYRANLRRLIAVIEGKHSRITGEIERDMKRAAKAKDFELAARLRDQRYALADLGRQIVFSDSEFLDISKDHALDELVSLLGLSQFPRRIEGYDISHMHGTDVVASMVVFTNGVSDKAQYRKFKMSRQQNDDFFNMHETITRRLSDKHLKEWGKPDLVLIDGGKGQLNAALRARDERGQTDIVFIGLAKREEQIIIRKHHQPGQQADPLVRDIKDGNSVPLNNVTINHEAVQRMGGFAASSDNFIIVSLPHSANLIKLLQRIRDESHRFAVSYHSTLKRKHLTTSSLENIAGIGPMTRRKLITTFGSVRGVRQASEAELVAAIGPAKAKRVIQNLHPDGDHGDSLLFFEK